MRRHCRGNFKKGSTVVFLSLIIASVVGAAIVFVIHAKKTAEVSYQRILTELACRSVLSEYDVRLKQDYGIFAFRGDGRFVSDMVQYYLDYTGTKSQVMFSLSNMSVSSDIKGFEIVSLENFEKQIIDAAKHNFFIRKGIDRVDSSLGHKAELKNEAVIENLPSFGFTKKNFEIDFSDLTATDLKGLIAGAGNTFFINSYIFSVFQCRTIQYEEKKSFFEYEIEYLLAGLFSDTGNLEKVRGYLVNLRTPVNIAKIYADPVRAQKALAEAELIAPGPGAPAAQLAIITKWAREDAGKEADELLNGGKVDGLSYKEYLMIFLSLQDRETKLLRIMDLIQINLRYSYYDHFLLQEHFCGFYLETELNGRRASYVHTY